MESRGTGEELRRGWTEPPGSQASSLSQKPPHLGEKMDGSGAPWAGQAVPQREEALLAVGWWSGLENPVW